MDFTLPAAFTEMQVQQEENDLLHRQQQEEIFLLIRDQHNRVQTLRKQQAQDLNNLRIFHQQQQERQADHHLAQERQLFHRQMHRQQMMEDDQLQSLIDEEMGLQNETQPQTETQTRPQTQPQPSFREQPEAPTNGYQEAQETGSNRDEEETRWTQEQGGLFESSQEAHGEKPRNGYSKAGLPDNDEASLQGEFEAPNEEVAPKKKPRNNVKGGKQDREVRACVNCHVIETPMWRTDASGNSLCNACGVYSRQNNTERPVEQTSKGAVIKKKPRPPKAENKDMVCANCGTHSTPTWRKGLESETLCNACGLHLRLHQNQRPKTLKTETFRKRGGGNKAVAAEGEGEDQEAASVLDDFL